MNAWHKQHTVCLAPSKCSVVMVISSLAHKERLNTETTVYHYLKDIHVILLEIPMSHVALTLRKENNCER